MKSSRREFLSFLGFSFGSAALFTSVGFVPSAKKLIRPPGGQNEKKFLSKCLKCQQCIDVCPEKSLRIAHLHEGFTASGTPVLFSLCTLCMECIKTCPSGALDQNTVLKNVKMGVAEVIPDECIGCDVCIRYCDFDAISSIEGKKLVKIDKEKCTGCFACVVGCPVLPVGIKVVPL